MRDGDVAVADEMAEGIFALSLPEPSCNAYLLKEAGAIVDAGMSEKREFDAELERAGFSVDQIQSVLLTHCHLDHAYNLKWLPKAVVYCGALTIDALKGRKKAFFEEIEFLFPKNKFVPVSDGEELRLGELTVNCISAPGHTNDSTCFLEEKSGILFSGDALFPTASKGALPRIFETGSLNELRSTYEKLENCGARALASGHYPLAKDFAEEIAAAQRALRSGTL